MSRFSSAQLVSSGDIRATTSAYGVSDVAAKPTMELSQRVSSHGS